MSRWFSIRRAGALFRVEALQLMCDRSALLLIFGLPVMQVLLYGYGVSFMPRDVPIVISSDSATAATRLSAAFKDNKVLRLLGPIRRTERAAEEAVTSGEVTVGMDVSTLDTDHVRVRIFVNGNDPATVSPVIMQLEVGVWRDGAEYYGRTKTATDKGASVPEVSTTWISGSPNDVTWAVAPGLVGVVVMVSMLFLGSMTLVRERERGTWESLLATPIRPAEALIGKLAPYLVIGMIETVMLLGVIHILFDVPLPVTSLALVAVSPIFAGAYLILGFVFSSVAQNQLQASQGAVGVYLPSLLMSGFLFPFSGMPTWARWVGEVMPLTHYLRASREILLGHAPAEIVLPQLVPIAIFAIAASVLAVIAYRRHLD
jgi:ABC-2 type transport system permease protein